MPPRPKAASLPVPTINAPVDTKPSWQVSLFDLLRKNLFAVAGIGLLLLGFVFLFHSIEWGHLLSPIAKVSLAWAAAAGLGFAGVRLSARNALWGQVVQGGAAAIGYLATYAGASGYEVLTPWTALTLFAAISGVLVWRSLKEDAKVLAGVGFLGAYAAPLLAMYGAGGLLFNLIYGLIVTASALWVSHTRRWQEIGVHAHVCAAGLASLATVGSAHEPALPAWQQQALLHAYLAQFAGWALIWANRYGGKADAVADARASHARSGSGSGSESESESESESDASASASASASATAMPAASGAARLAWETPILVTCFSMSVVLYLGVQGWLLGPLAFMAVAFAAAAMLGLGAMKAFPQPALRETAWVLAAFSVAAGLMQGDLSPAVSSLGLFAEGAILMLSARDGSFIRRWVARGLVIVGAVSMTGVTGSWPAGLLLLAALALSLRMDYLGRALDARLAAVITVGAAAVFTYRQLGLGAEAWPTFVLILLAVTAVSVAVRMWRRGPALGEVRERPTPTAPAPVPNPLAMPVRTSTRTSTPTPVSALFAGALALAWLALVPSQPTLARAMNLAALIAPVVFGAAMAGWRLRRPMDPRLAEPIKAQLWLAGLLPALVAHALSYPWPVIALLAVTGTAAFAQVLRAWPALAALGAGGAITAPRVALVGLLTSAIPLVLAAEPSAETTQAVWWLAAIAFFAALATWRMLGDAVPVEARRVATAALGVAMGYVVVRGATDGPDAAFPLAWESYLLPLALAAVGVASLFLSTRRRERLAWQVSAVVCAIAMAKLLLSLGSWAFSPMGIVGSLLGMGALFLLAGYLAPQPPAREAPPAVGDSPAA
ncbi:DUF2339 domain-containing protein [Mitsuaria sp. GD03876]|uniref:DUF2339 domain-containing protein n=1 Tax=Mitsuaria sp. GD03876 TaxID=2975399 RepID=UPI00244812DC|nr:DUF2339 domain-containing protein [Mitsuaria sp. GD03876]MDH0863867.1 DUF2339 domain-containing protein [Mitsuaria sp. GD03876]